jgi:glycosyltransferase involved in cell wall biosynthesis
MNLTEITPMILTHNEEANLRQTLRCLSWASSILVVDSYSTDATLEIVKEFSQVRLIQRGFDHFADQCNFGLQHIDTSWVLSLDADYRCDAKFEQELRELDPVDAGYQARFRYGIYGKPLRASLYPPRTVLYRREKARYLHDGHAHRVEIDGATGNLRTFILHDDWKPLSVWFHAQTRYAVAEADKLLENSPQNQNWKDRIRRTIVLAPFLTLIYCLMCRGLLLDGWRGIFYAMQRSFAELVLSIVLLDRYLRRQSGSEARQSSRVR